MRRRDFITLLSGAAACSITARAQQPVKVFQIGVLYPGAQAAMPSRLAAIQSGLEAGGVRADQIGLLTRVANGEPALLTPLAADLVARNVNLIFAISPAAVRAVRAATNNIPIVAGDLESDPIASGFVASHPRPGGNITGLFMDFPDFSKKWLEVLKETLPQLSTVAVLWDPATGAYQLNAIEAAAQTLGLKLVRSEVPRPVELEAALQSAAQNDAGAVLMLSSPVIGGNTKLLANSTLKYRLPAITLFTEFARDGGLMAYGPNLLGVFRQEGVMAAKILLGANPAVMPIERPTKFEFVLNLKTAKALGLTIPASVLLRADEVIE